MGTGIALLPTHPATHPGYTPPRTMLHATATGTAAAGVNMVVGLISVAQLPLDAQISGFLGMTEVYNLLRIGRINNHLLIPGNK